MKPLSLLLFATMALTVSANNADYASWPTYNGSDLELTVDNKGTHFALWSPQAQAAQVLIYPTGEGSKPSQTLDMKLTDNGVWRVSVPEALYGKFYTFRIRHNDKWLAETPGVWAKAVGINGNRAAIIDFAKTNPEGWESDKGPETKNITDAVIYEMHHRDFSMHPSSGIQNKGKFLALTEEGTKNNYGNPTGIDHLKELGVTHVHILPSFDYNSVDEANLGANTYNWGYDPKNYNAPEGSYSTNPSDPEARIREMKEMIMALHKAGIGVVMDVVYNHTAEGDNSNFSLTAPGYYYRHNEDGSYSDASGCGNETASERQQMSDYIVRSVCDWARDYHIDGFRFDLMGIHDIKTMNRVAEELKKINPSIIIYGEGWTAGGSPLPENERLLKEKVGRTRDIAVFSDDIRDAIKGHYSKAEDRGFATGKPGLEETVKLGIVGGVHHPQIDYKACANSKFPYARVPSQVINYVSCHDDLCLTDKLRKSMTDPKETEADRQRAAILAQTIVFTSQCTPFLFAGEEVFRDKKGVHNSYNQPDSINAIDWDLLNTNSKLYKNYCELIKLRKEHPAFRMTNPNMVARAIRFDDTKNMPNVISYSIMNHANGDKWAEIKLVFNGNDKPVRVNLPKGMWRVVARDGNISADAKLGIIHGGMTMVEPRSALIVVH